MIAHAEDVGTSSIWNLDSVVIPVYCLYIYEHKSTMKKKDISIILAVTCVSFHFNV